MFLASAAFLALALFPVAVPPLVPLLPLSQLHALYPSGRRLLWETWSSGVRGMLVPPPGSFRLATSLPELPPEGPFVSHCRSQAPYWAWGTQGAN